jgi:hypothetical protein
MGSLTTIGGRLARLGLAALAVAGFAGFLALGADGRLTERTATATVPPDSLDTSADARCPKGKRVVLGGFDVAGDDTYVTHLKREGKRHWLAGAKNYDGDETGTVAATAYCAKLKGIKVRTETVSVPAQGIGDAPVTVEAKCRRKERLAFGGFDITTTDDNDAYLSDLRRIGKRGGLVGAFNFDSTAPLTAIAYCSKDAPKASTESETVTLAPSEDTQLTARCGRGERLAFGGFSGEVSVSDGFVVLKGLARTGGRGWRVTAREESSNFAGDLSAYAYCAKK